MANTLQEKIAQLRKEQEEKAEVPAKEKGGKTLFQRNKEEKSTLDEKVEALNDASLKLDKLDLGEDATAKVKEMIIKDAVEAAKQQKRTQRIANTLVTVLLGCVVVAAIVGVIGLIRLVFGF